MKKVLDVHAGLAAVFGPRKAIHQQRTADITPRKHEPRERTEVPRQTTAGAIADKRRDDR